MRVIAQANGSLILSGPETLAEKVLMENIHTILTNGWGKTVEFEASSMASSGNVTHVALKLVVPVEFEDDLTGEGGIVKKESRCHICGGPDH